MQSISRAAGCGRLNRGDRATTTEPVRRYQRERPGELIHVDVKKIAGTSGDGPSSWLPRTLVPALQRRYSCPARPEELRPGAIELGGR